MSAISQGALVSMLDVWHAAMISDKSSHVGREGVKDSELFQRRIVRSGSRLAPVAGLATVGSAPLVNPPNDLSSLVIKVPIFHPASY